MLNRFAIPICIASATVFILSCIFFSSLVSKNKLAVRGQVNHFETLSNSISTTFTPSHSNLNIILIPLKNPGLLDVGSYTLKLYSDTQLLRELQFTGHNVGDPTDLKFQFAPIADSKNLPLRLALDAQSASSLKVGISNSKLALTSYYRHSNPLVDFLTSASSLVSTIIYDSGFIVVWLGSIVVLLVCTRLRVFRYN